ncbi:transcriptional regulator [Sporosarcina ureae]|uniref:HTH-type transcriptional regulator Hpr n=1 Tax=Sporosarcina ureae TaxID=1571 RepID=UPI000A15050A|nr:HTH-type transcriptional regulator Hpr [Sporosarcina ureae]ARJ38380.1 transcriptional regulator [Sporosarcina ureae]
MADQHISRKDAMIFNQRVAQMSKALWKAVEKDWQQWIKPYELNINEHHILWIAYHLEGATISDIAKFGVMHVSTAFNFSKKEDDRRNTYVTVSEEGKALLIQMNENYHNEDYSVLQGSLPIRDIYGKFPEFLEVMSVLRNIYGDDFMDIFERGFQNIEKTYVDSSDYLIKSKVES